MADQPLGMLVLEDGSFFTGPSMGADGDWVGEVVFNTSMTGYQEIITDPSYWGQMVAFTCPHIGNVGVNPEDIESSKPYVRAVLARQICAHPSNWRSQQPLPQYLAAHGIPALSGIDTRRLTLLLREKGVMRGALSSARLDRERLWEMARNAPDMSSLSPAEHVARPRAEPWTVDVPPAWQPSLAPSQQGAEGRQADSWEAGQQAAGAAGPHIVVVDCGAKYNILRSLTTLGTRITVAPSRMTAAQIMAMHPDGVLVANGPGDPVNWPDTTANVAGLLGQVPMMGICLGHQLIALASGARTYKLPFGHHGGNHPVQDLATGAIAITAQNHNYAVVEESLAGLSLEVTHRNLNDGTIGGLRHTQLPVFSVQYHPEASPGPHDSLYLLRRFVRSLT